ncbi:hypothetical protein [Pedobacter metabolipauper]|uniref:Uncharacterized protein n=1 Tax=Pedobacter metabolipauper TaxID=425513 RepID=A0A4R6T181_9SPHI|nr:hypothetical protein [Pedobacter metabolipauper]TDQ12212.1 hypothetical protein ATK78_1346 [Pedobacter metabolipauper]
MKITKSITSEELEAKKAVAEEAHELKAGTKVKIVEASLGKSGINLKYWKVVTRDFENIKGEMELREFENPGAEKMPFLPHPDLLLAFDLLRPHLLLACQQKEAYDAYGDLISPVTFESFVGEDQDNPLSRFKVTGFAINDSETGVTLTGLRFTRGSATLPLSQYLDFHGGENAYEFGDEAYHVIKHARNEVLLYYNGKIAPDSQYSLDFDDAASDME